MNIFDRIVRGDLQITMKVTLLIDSPLAHRMVDAHRSCETLSGGLELLGYKGKFRVRKIAKVNTKFGARAEFDIAPICTADESKMAELIELMTEPPSKKECKSCAHSIGGEPVAPLSCRRQPASWPTCKDERSFESGRSHCGKDGIFWADRFI